jgi:uncharacterized LabA/DUF88 family protein
MGILGDNYGFIDGNNIHLSAKELGWKIDNHKLRVYLSEKYHVSVAYYFIGFIKENEVLYRHLSEAGFTLIFKEVAHDADGNVKGNIDAELVLHVMIDFGKYEQAVIVTSDGDFACLTKYLLEKRKLYRILATSKGGCSNLLNKAAGPRVDYLDSLRGKLEYKK